MEIEGAFRHFCHKDALVLWDDNYDHLCCSVCKQTISGKHYRCAVFCNFGIHDSCLEIPRYIVQHPFHPQHHLFISDEFVSVYDEDFCNSCGGSCAASFIYKCSACSFLLDVKCALLTLAIKNSEQEEDQDLQKKIHEQPNHPHPLIFCDRKDKRFSYACGCCDLPFDDDDGGLVYVCLQCKALLHKSCAELSWNVEHPFHPSHPLILLPHGHEGFLCGLCSHKRNGFTYHCSQCEFDMDVHCASLKPASNNEGQVQKVQQFTHSHPLISCNSKHKFPHSCHGCQLLLVGSIYFCPECNILLHESCANTPQEIRHLFHPQHTLTLLYHRYGQCGACLCYSTGFFFKCSQCEWYLDGRCALLNPTTMMSQIHPHPLALLDDARYLMECSTCCKHCLPPFFRCVLCDFNLDVRCISKLPPIIKYKYHVHKLHFADYPIKDPDDEDNAEYYCNACEERRELAHQSYYCKECPYVAHPHCVVYEIIRVLEKGWSMQDSHSSADEVKIMRVLEVEEEWSKQQSHASTDEAEIEKEREMEMEPGIQHFSHKHKLFLHEGDFPYDCSACKQTILGVHYRCRHGCEFGIHNSCLEMPRFVQHPLHPQHDLFISEIVTSYDFCNSCGDPCNHGFVYECRQCSFLLDVKCALLTLAKNSNEKEQYHQKKIHEQPNHPHPLILCDHKDKRFTYTCNCCQLPFDAGVSIYVCLQCKSLLHKSCMELPWSIEHPFHPSHPLILHPRTPYSSEFYGDIFFCQGCCQKLKGFTYHCSECFFDLDVRCAALKPTKNNEGQDQIQQFSHKHPLILCNSKQNFPYHCNACRFPLVDSIYYCPKCNVLLHKSCANLPKEMNHLLHPQHTLNLRYGRHVFDCGACLQSFKGFYFECSQCEGSKREWCMDVRCALSEPTTMVYKFHRRHPLALLNEASQRITCRVCHQPCLPPFFRCVLCNFNLDVRCISKLPPVIKYKNHVHKLYFTESPIKDPDADADADAEFYCNACEERRELAHQCYYCKECPYVAHPHCVVYEIIRLLEKEWSSRRAM